MIDKKIIEQLSEYFKKPIVIEEPKDIYIVAKDGTFLGVLEKCEDDRWQLRVDGKFVGYYN